MKHLSIMIEELFLKLCFSCC